MTSATMFNQYYWIVSNEQSSKVISIRTQFSQLALLETLYWKLYWKLSIRCLLSNMLGEPGGSVDSTRETTGESNSSEQCSTVFTKSYAEIINFIEPRVYGHANVACNWMKHSLRKTVDTVCSKPFAVAYERQLACALDWLNGLTVCVCVYKHFGLPMNNQRTAREIDLRSAT